MVWRSMEIARELPDGIPVGTVVLAHQERHLRRKLLHLVNGDMVMLDLKQPVHLESGDLLVLQDGNFVEVMVASEPLYRITGQSPLHLSQLAWHLGNRHLAAQIEEDRILILRDHVIAEMLTGLGASITEVNEPFNVMKGAYYGRSADRQGGGNGGGHHHDH